MSDGLFMSGDVGPDAVLLSPSEIDVMIGRRERTSTQVVSEGYFSDIEEDSSGVWGSLDVEDLGARVSDPKKGGFTPKSILKVAAVAGLAFVVSVAVLSLLAVLPFVWAIPIALMGGATVAGFFSSLTLGSYIVMQIITLGLLGLTSLAVV